jgi:hypothetical protein
MKMHWAAGLVMAGTLAVAPAGMQAQATGQPLSVTGANSSGAGVASAELMGSTVHEAWLSSGRNEDTFFNMVQQLAEISAQKRGITLPDTEAAGRKMGLLIKASARRDPDQLLYAVVDAAVKQTAKSPTTATK